MSGLILPIEETGLGGRGEAVVVEREDCAFKDFFDLHVPIN
jgi:hypothetical protein